MFCSYCGKKLPEGARFCIMCGTKVALPVEVTEEPDEPVVKKPEVQTPEVIVDEAAVARAEAKATAAVPPESREVPATQPAAPVRTRIAFDWSNVKDEPQKKQILNVKSPWEETGGFDEEALYKEMTPSTDRSRTMNFIDIYKAEKEENKIETPAAPEEEFPTEKTHDDEPPRLHFAPLYEDFDTPVKTPFDDPEHTEHKKYKEPDEKDAVDKAPVHKAEPAKPVIGGRSSVKEVKEDPKADQPAEKPAWHWFEMPDFLKSKTNAAEPVEQKKETETESSSAAEFRFQTPESALFEEPRFEKETVSAEPETQDEPEDELFDSHTDMMFDVSSDEEYDEHEADYSEYEKYDEYADYADYSEYEEPAEPEVQFFDEPAKEQKPEPEPEQNHGAYTYVYDEEVSGSETDYTDYINMDISRSSSADETDGRTASYAAAEEVHEEPVAVAAEQAEPAVYEPEPAAELSAEADTVRTDAGEVPAAESQSLADDLADILAAGAQKPLKKEEEAVPIDEAELFAEIEATAPKKKDMTIAAPADEISEVEALKRRVAELTGAPDASQSGEPEIISLKKPETDIVAEPVISISDEIKNAEPVEPEIITLEGAEPAVLDESFVLNVPAEEPVAEAAETDPIDDELFKFLSDESETDSKTPVYGLTPFSELEEEVAAEAESEGITLTGPETDDSVDILEALAALDTVPELGAAAESQPAMAEKSGVIDLSSAPQQAAEVKPQDTDALSLEDLETDLYGETPSPAVEAATTKKIDKFYTLYRKNEEFQRLLDEEYSKLKTESHPAAVESSKPVPAGTAAPPVREVEDVTIYQELTPEEQKTLSEAGEAQMLTAEALAATAAETATETATEPKPVEVKAAPVEWDQIAAEEKAAAKKETRREKKERKKREKEELKAREAAVDAAASEYEYEDTEQGSVFLTVVAVIIAILLVILLAIILVLNFAPDSSIALQIDSVIENITSHFSAIDNTGGQYLL